VSKSKIKNVLFLTVDCLQFTLLSAGRNKLNICPTINSLAENGILCWQARAHGFPSQMTFSSILTSTLPLDYGGYDTGILNKPVTLAESLQNCGLHTIGFSSSPWLGLLYGYDRGFNEFYELFDIDKLWKIFVNVYHKFYANLFAKDIITKSEFCEIIGKSFSYILVSLQSQCANKRREIQEYKFSYRMELHRHDFKAMQEALRKIASDFSAHSDEYIMKKMRNGLEADIGMFLMGNSTQGTEKAFLIKNINRLLKLLSVQLWRHLYSVPASYLKEQVIATIQDNRKTPFFLWTHFLDIHDKTYIAGRVGFPPSISLGLKHLISRGNPASLTQTFSLRFIDNNIAQIIASLKSQDLLDSTLIVIAGDHGMNSKSPEKMAGNLFDESTHVPLIFYNPNIEPRIISEPCGLIDIAPTILDLLGKNPCSDFTGRSLVRPLSSDYPVILESLGPGPCDMNHKAIKMAVIRGRYKLIWREPGYENTCPAGDNYLFDLEADPGERKNLYSDQKYSKIVSELENIVHERCNKLRNRHQETG